jgi:hypothetical protein
MSQARRHPYRRQTIAKRCAPAAPGEGRHRRRRISSLCYQELVERHDLILDLGPDAGRDSTFLFLRGWIYPTDASINVALSQSNVKLIMPSLEVRDARGQWTTAAPIGFPSGKDKTIVVDLSGKFPTRDHHVRIRTNLQIYWDQAFVGRNLASPATRITSLPSRSADLHARGYSRTYRKAGATVPGGSTMTASARRRCGGRSRARSRVSADVRSLLGQSDDMYVIMAPGDEATLGVRRRVGGRVLHGWTRDFLLYSDGWIKDSDLNTAFGTTVAPLPFHAIREYPYAAGESYPTDSTHRAYLRDYNTRAVNRAGSVRAGGQRSP